MTRKTMQWPNVKPGDYVRWRKEFEDGPFVRKLLAKFTPPKAEHICATLFAAQLGPRRLTRDEVRRTWTQLNKPIDLTSRIDLTDYIITFLAVMLKGKTRSVNEDIAALLTAAGIPDGKHGSGEWSAEAIKKRRARANAQKRVCLPMFGERLLLKKLSVRLLAALLEQ